MTCEFSGGRKSGVQCVRRSWVTADSPPPHLKQLPLLLSSIISTDSDNYVFSDMIVSVTNVKEETSSPCCIWETCSSSWSPPSLPKLPALHLDRSQPANLVQGCLGCRDNADSCSRKSCQPAGGKGNLRQPSLPVVVVVGLHQWEFHQDVGLQKKVAAGRLLLVDN